MEMNLSTILTVEEFITNSVCEIEMKRKRGPEKFFLPQNRVWVVPGYQREIRWKAINVETLFENIYNSEKFLGTILISKTSDTRFEIIDGQQRITVLLLFINALEKTGNVRSIDLCEYYNETLESFDKMLEYGFDEKRMRENGILEECTEKDILDQCDALKEIWDTLVRCVNDVVPRRRTSLLDKVLKSSFNVILSNESGGTTSNSICVDYYLDLNAKAVKLDSIDILKAELFRKNYQLMTEKWKNVQRAIKRWNLNETNYPNNTFYFHFFASDLTQAIGKMAIDVHALGIDFASCSAHKIYGPKGVGAAFLKNDAYGIPPITAFMHGGEQENGFRAGTLAVHNIVGFGKAAEIAIRDLKANEQRIMQLDQVMVSGISTIPGISLTNPSEKRLPGIISIVVDKKDFNNERFIKNISDKFALSTGSACSAGEPSYVITALGLEDRVSKVLRISLNKYTTEEEIHQLINILKSEL